MFAVGALAAMTLFAGLGAGIGALAGVLIGGSVSDATFVGAMIGLGTVMAWFLLLLVVVAVLWVRAISPAETATGRQPSGRHAASYGWRRRGQPLVPVSLVLFFAGMTVLIGADGAHSWHESRPWPEPTSITDGTVVAEHEPAWFDRGSGTVIVRYAVGGVDYSIETGRDPDDRFLRAGDVVPVEYVVARPAAARSTWAVEGARSDGAFGLTVAGICAGLAAISGVCYLVGRWRSSGRLGG